MIFSDDFLQALATWQNGWGTDQTRRKPIGDALLQACEALPKEFKTANGRTCYRKRFIHTGELVPIFVDDARDEEIGSWTFNEEFARGFRKLRSLDPGAITAAIFKRIPPDDEVVVNIPALWQDDEFIAAAEAYRERNKPYAKALFHFVGPYDQDEIVLKSAPLQGSQIHALAAPVKTFDEYCDMLGFPNDKRRDVYYRQLTDAGRKFGEPDWISPSGTANVSARVALTGHLVNAINKGLEP